MFRPEIKVVDCTIRDGGLANDSHFTMETVRTVFEATCRAGVDYVELGYRNSRAMLAPATFGPWRYCDEQLLHEATDGVDRGDTKLAIMMDAHKADPEDLQPAEESVVDMIRVATYVKDVDKAIALSRRATDLGYENTINIMAISIEGSPFLDEALDQIEAETRAQAVYVVDSFGALYSEQVWYFVEKFRQHLKTKEIGIHSHNNQQLAFANTIEGIIRGANYVDGTLFGLGRAAGNCPLELLLGFLKNPKFNIRPVLDAITRVIRPLAENLDWGYHIPYMLTGILNRHPQEAMSQMKTAQKHDYVAFYNRLIDETPV